MQVNCLASVCGALTTLCATLQLRQAHNISNVLDKVHLQLDRMGNLGRP
eukprot:COSAG02_NODE_6300_length_3669_cov_2.392437_5_plen_49_part_00